MFCLKQVKLFVYSKTKNSQTISALPPTMYEFKQSQTQLIAEDGCFLTNGEKYYEIINVPNEEVDQWGEFLKKDFRHIFGDKV